jgi:hypothetical protein
MPGSQPRHRRAPPLAAGPGQASDRRCGSGRTRTPRTCRSAPWAPARRPRSPPGPLATAAEAADDQRLRAACGSRSQDLIFHVKPGSWNSGSRQHVRTVYYYVRMTASPGRRQIRIFAPSVAMHKIGPGRPSVRLSSMRRTVDNRAPTAVLRGGPDQVMADLGDPPMNVLRGRNCCTTADVGDNRGTA